MDTVLFALWFFLPAGVANTAPIIAAKLPVLKKIKTPMDGGAHFRGKPVFGANKTWRGLFSGIVAAIIIVYLQQLIYQNYHIKFLDRQSAEYLFYSPILLGFLFGFGALIGDAIESFFKRQHQVPAGEPWFPFDQIDYIIGGCLVVSLVARLSLIEYLSVLIVWFVMHLGFSYLGFKLGFKAKPI